MNERLVRTILVGAEEKHRESSLIGVFTQRGHSELIERDFRVRRDTGRVSKAQKRRQREKMACGRSPGSGIGATDGDAEDEAATPMSNSSIEKPPAKKTRTNADPPNNGKQESAGQEQGQTQQEPGPS